LAQRTDDNGWAGFVLPAGLTSLQLQSPLDTYLNLNAFPPPVRLCLSPQGNVERARPWLELRQAPADTTAQTTFHLLCKTVADAKAYIDNDSCHVYKTGIFFNTLHLQPGMNRYAVRVSTDSAEFDLVRQVFVKRAVALRGERPLWIDSTSVEPREDLWLSAQDKIAIRCKGSPGRKIFAGFAGQKQAQLLQSTEYHDYALYEGELVPARLTLNKEHHVILIIKDRQGRIESKRVLPAKIRISEPDAFPLVRTRHDKTGMSYNLGPIRLGGPLVAEYPAGVILKSSGRIGQQVRVRLNDSDQGFVAAADVEELSGETVRPTYYLTSISAGPGRNSDVVSIPYPETVPYAIRPEPELSRIRLILYGVKTSSTWITHRQGLKLVDRVTWQQTDPETYEVLIYLHSKKIWGYQLQKKNSTLEFQVFYPPPLSVQADTLRLKGLVLAIEAGHGGSNSGALGLSGLEEKAVNLQVAQELARLCQSRGIEVVQVRPDDREMGLEEKQNIIETSNAHLAVSIHANAASTLNGFLGANGASTYYNNPFWSEFAEKVYGRLLQLPLKEFGAVGHFNYRVIRISSRPTILVEQAFMTHAGDEEKLFDPDFQRQMAEKILQGINDYLSYMFDKPVR
jgi:N-acetylmuramoyl-L-alanine amidase